MSDRDHPADEAIRRVAGHLEPSESERLLAEERLRAAIEAELAGSDRRWWPWVAAAAVLVGVFFGLQTLGSTPTEAAMEEIATVVETIDPAQVGDQQFLYTRSDNLALAVLPADMLENVAYDDEYFAYRLPGRRQTWLGNDGVVQLATTSQEPVFFTEADEEIYYEAGLDELDNIGETVTDTVQDERDFDQWPTDPGELDAAIREQLPADTGRPESVEYLDIAIDLIREVWTPPELRAATLTVIGMLPDLELVTQDEAEATFTIEYEDNGLDTRQTFTISSRGDLLAEQTLLLEPDPELGIPADTVLFEATYSTPEVIDSLDQP